LRNPSIALSAGHSPFDKSHPGASHNGLNEYELGCQIIPELVRELYSRNYTIYVVGGSLSDRIKQINQLPLNAAVEIHFNAYHDQRVRGCETLHGHRVESRSLAKCVQHQLVESLKGYPNFTVKPEHDWKKAEWINRGIKLGLNHNTPDPSDMVAYLAEVQCPACIVEPGFLSSPLDAEMLKDEDWDIHGRIAEGICLGIQGFVG